MLPLEDELASDQLVGEGKGPPRRRSVAGLRMNGHIGTETRPRLLREAAVGNLPQWAKA